MTDYAAAANDAKLIKKLRRNTLVLPNGCWELRLKSRSNGYGVISHGGKSYLAHRLSYYMAKGEPTGPVIRHQCNNRPCINPSHLHDGTHAENTEDMIRAGRTTAKLTETAVRDIRREVQSTRDHISVGRMMIKYNVCASSICAVVKGRMFTWVK